MRSFLILCFLLVAVLADAQIDFRLYSENNRRGTTIFANNSEHYPVSLQFTFTLENMVWRNYGQQVFVVPARSLRFRVTELEQDQPSLPYRFSYRYRYTKGNVQAQKVDTSFVYDLPFAKGKVHRVMQGYGGRFSHQGVFALDFQMDDSSLVTAARDGVVAEVVNHNELGCPERACADMANYVLVHHADDSFAEYYHLRKGGALVKGGQKVKRGDPIGLSGNTGFSSAPHLHFAVFVPGLEGRTTLPTLFRTGTGEEVEKLETGRLYPRNY